MQDATNPTRRRFVGTTAATLVALGLSSTAVAADGDEASSTVSGTVRGVYDGRAALRGPREGKSDWRTDVAYDDIDFSFANVPDGDHRLQVFEENVTDDQDDEDDDSKLLQRSVDPGDTLDIRVDNVRGVWAVPKALEEMKTEIDRYSDLGITDLYLRTFHLAQTVFPSTHAPTKGQFDDDYFGAVLEYAHENDIRVHAWMQACYWWHATYYGDVSDWHPLAGDDEIDYKSPYFDEPITLDRDRVTAREDGIVIAENGKIFASPFNEENRELLRDVTKELTDQYDVDGVHLDYIRFPGFRYYDKDGDGDKDFVGEPYGYGNSSPIESSASYEEAQDQRIGAITDIVEEVGDVLQRDVVLSAAVFNSFYTDPEGARLNRNKAQDWKSWIGTTEIDWLHPMVYESIWGFDELTEGLEFAFDAEEDPVTILPGLTNIGGHASFEEQWEKSLSKFDISGYVAFKGETIESLDELP